MIRTLQNRKKRDQEKGFTLVELAIVIVIIGLIVGGILVGQDLIKAATIRATLGDLEKYNSGATTFRTKYGGLPGDILSDNASQFGLASDTGGSSARNGTEGRGDGNGLIAGCSRGATALGCETSLFWADLSQAGLIPQAITTAASNVASDDFITGINSISQMQDYMPTQRVRQGTFQHVFTLNGRNNFALASYETDGSGNVIPDVGVTPGEARSMDEKLDDAFPHVGVVVAVATGVGNLGTINTGAASPASGDCVAQTGQNRVYNVTDQGIDEINCVVRFRASF